MSIIQWNFDSLTGNISTCSELKKIWLKYKLDEFKDCLLPDFNDDPSINFYVIMGIVNSQMKWNLNFFSRNFNV